MEKRVIEAMKAGDIKDLSNLQASLMKTMDNKSLISGNDLRTLLLEKSLKRDLESEVFIPARAARDSFRAIM